MTLIAPVPPDAPPPPASLKGLGAPAASYTYRSATGAVLCHILRFQQPGGQKIFVPVTLWLGQDGAREWLRKNLPTPRPLYGLERLVASPDANVIVCEGEKATEAARVVFPDSVCVTSPNGANSAGKADWSPLAGRRVLICPDADKAGSNYANEVAATLQHHGCDVSIVDVHALASITASGETRDPPSGYDMADAVEEWADREALRRLILELSCPFAPEPNYVSWGHYKMGEKGLFVEIRKGRGESETSTSEYLSSPFEIEGATRDPNGQEWGLTIRYFDADQREHIEYVSYAALHADPSALCGLLAGKGLWINRQQQKHFVTYLSSVSAKGRVTLVSRTGWHLVGGRLVFVLPTVTLGPKGSEAVRLQEASLGPYAVCGTLEDWKAGVGALSCGHVLVILAISAALAGPLCHLAEQEGGGINFFGRSSLGKTTLLQAAASVWGRGGSPGYVRVWRATANGLEGAAASATDTVLILDELGVVEARDAAAAIYGLANGTGKSRARRDGSLREPKAWRVIVISSGEMPVEIKLSEDRGRRAQAGQLVRLLDIPSDRGQGFGAFDRAGPEGDPGALAKAFKQAATTAYGTAGPAFVQALLDNELDGADIRSQIQTFVSNNCPPGADGQVQRAAQRFGLIASAGELATLFGLIPWHEGDATAAAVWALSQWIERRGGGEPVENEQALTQVRRFMESHGESRFQDPDEMFEDGSARPVYNRAGWRRGHGEDRVWQIPPESWKEICVGFDPKFVARVLWEKGVLLRGADGFTQVHKIDGGSKRVYVITGKIFAGGGHEV